jgi:hypothetical protein
MLHKSIIKLTFLFFAVGCTLLQFGCKKDNNGGAPVISKIRAVSPSPNDSTLSKAGPGQTIVIQGANLSTTSQIYFNGYSSPFNSALFSDNSLVVTIPADMPFASLDQSKLNTIRIVTQFGEVTYTFPIQPPPPVINSMTNEMAVAGERVTLYGNNFFFITKVVFPGNIEVNTNIVTNASGTTLNVTVPAGITLGGPLQVVNQYGIGTSLLRFNDFATGMLCNFDDVNTINNWAGAIISNSTADFPNGHGTFIELKFSNVAAGDWAWYGGGRSINCEVSRTWVPVSNLSDPPSSWALIFEINTKVPWKNGTILLDKDYGWNYQGRFDPWTSGDYNSNGWKTIVVPLSNFKQSNGTGNAPANLAAVVGAGGAGGVNMYFINAGTTTVASYDVAIDNIRVIKIN